MRTARIATVAALVALTATACGTDDINGRYSPREKTVSTTGTSPTPEPTPTENAVKALDETVTYESKIKLQLTDYKRDVLKDTIYNDGKPVEIIAFNLTITNGSPEPLDLGALMVSAQYGDVGQESERVFYTTDNPATSYGTPSTTLLTGRSSKVAVAFLVPKTETYLQIEVTPDFTSETAIFSGHVPK